MKIGSIVDVITNSSSEVYLIKTDLREEKLREILSGLIPEDRHCSGMGGIIEVMNNKDYPKDEYDPPYDWIPDNTLVVHFDWAYRDEILGYLKDNNMDPRNIDSEECQKMERDYIDKEMKKLEDDPDQFIKNFDKWENLNTRKYEN